MDKHRFTLIIIGIFGVGILAGGWFLGVQPQLNRIGDAAAQVESVRQLNEAQTQVNAALAADYQRLGEFQGALDAAKALIPDRRSQQALIDQIEAAADAAGVTIKTINFDAPVAFTPTVGVPVNLPATSTLVAIPVDITVAGERSSTEAFAAGLQGAARIVTVTGSEYRGPEDPSLTLSGTTWVLMQPTA